MRIFKIFQYGKNVGVNGLIIRADCRREWTDHTGRLQEGTDWSYGQTVGGNGLVELSFGLRNYQGEFFFPDNGHSTELVELPKSHSNNQQASFFSLLKETPQKTRKKVTLRAKFGSAITAAYSHSCLPQHDHQNQLLWLERKSYLHDCTLGVV